MKSVEGNLELISEIFSGVGNGMTCGSTRRKKRSQQYILMNQYPSHQIIVINIINIASQPRQLLTC